MTAQAPTRGITDSQFFDQGGIVQSSLLKISQCLRGAFELLLIERGGLLEYSGRGGRKSTLLVEVGGALAGGLMAGEPGEEKGGAAPPPNLALKEILSGVGMEPRAGF